MRIGYFYPVGANRELDSELLRFLKQIGVEDIVLSEVPGDPNTGVVDTLDLVHFRTSCENQGLRLIAVENIYPQQRSLEAIILGLPDRDQRLEELLESVRNIGRAGIPYFAHHWMIPPKQAGSHGVIRTSFDTPARGGASAMSFDIDLARSLPLFRERQYSAEELWDNYRYFLQCLLPVADEAGVTIGLHPDDPPITETLGGIPRIFTSRGAFKRASDLADKSRSWGLTFCLGNWALIGQDSLGDIVREFGSQGRINYVHLQATQGTPNRFTECFFDEGDCDFFEVVRVLREVGFDGTLVPAHVPRLQGDDERLLRSFSYAVGYTSALLKRV